MKLWPTHFKLLNKGKINFFCCLHFWAVLMLFLFSGSDSAEAQEYATDRLFMKHYKKTKCRNEAEKTIRKIKKRPEMTLEHEVLLIQNIWVKLRSNLPLSSGEKKLLKKLKEKGLVSKKKRSKEIWKNNNFEAKIYHIPGHTSGHICYHFYNQNILFTGDTLFSLGCGRIFEGNHKQMLSSLNKIKKLPKETKIYCGHEYTLQNSKFCIQYDKENQNLIKKIEEINKIPGVKSAWGDVLGFAQYVKVVDGETVLISNGFAPTFGAAWDTSPYASQWELLSGRPPVNNKELVMDKVTAENNEFNIGDKVTVLAGAIPATFKIVGIAQFSEVGSPGGATFALFEFRTAQKLLDSEGVVDLINVVIELNADIEEVRLNIESLDPGNLSVIDAQEAAAEQANNIKQGLDFFNTILNVFAGIAIFVGAFIIQNTFRILIFQRTKELALLRALGTSRRQVYRLVLSESLFMSIIGSGLGIGLGIGLAVLVKEGLNRFNFGLPEGPLVLTPSAAIIGAVVGVSVTVLSSLLPAIRASKVSPMEAIREGFSQPKKKSLVKRLLVGLLTTSLGFSLLFGTIFDFFEVPGLSSLRQVGIGAAITFVGIAILAPSFSKPFISIFHYIYIFFFKILGKLSIENSKRTPRRTAATASALMIGLTLITLANVITTSFKAQSESLIKGVVLADYQISAAQVFVSPGVPAGLGEELLKLDEVTELGRVRATVAAFEDSPILLGGLDEAIFKLIKTKDISGDISKFREENTLGVLKQKAERDNLSIGDSLLLYIPEKGEINFEIGYIFDWTTPPPAELFLLLDNYDFLKNETLDTELYLNVKEKNGQKVSSLTGGESGSSKKSSKPFAYCIFK